MKRILVLEDEDAIRRLTIDLLTDEGYDVRAARDGREGLEILQDWSPDLIVLDLMMPVMDGQTFHAALTGEQMEIPVIVLSASRTAKSVGEAIGATATILKPFDLNDFVAAIAGALNGNGVAGQARP